MELEEGDDVVLMEEEEVEEREVEEMDVIGVDFIDDDVESNGNDEDWLNCGCGCSGVGEDDEDVEATALTAKAPMSFCKWRVRRWMANARNQKMIMNTK